MSGDLFSASSRCVAVYVLGTEGWILDTNYPLQHVGREKRLASLFIDLWVHTEDAHFHIATIRCTLHIISTVSKQNAVL